MIRRTVIERSYHGATSRSSNNDEDDDGGGKYFYRIEHIASQINVQRDAIWIEEYRCRKSKFENHHQIFQGQIFMVKISFFCFLKKKKKKKKRRKKREKD